MFEALCMRWDQLMRRSRLGALDTRHASIKLPAHPQITPSLPNTQTSQVGERADTPTYFYKRHNEWLDNVRLEEKTSTPPPIYMI